MLVLTKVYTSNLLAKYTFEFEFSSMNASFVSQSVVQKNINALT